MASHPLTANLLELNRQYPLPYIPDLVARKLGGHEQSILPDADLEFHRREYDRLRAQLQSAHEQSALPEAASAKPALHDLLLRLRRVE